MSAWSDRAVYMFERRCLPLVLLGIAIAGCSSTGDGSVGIGSGQNPDPVAPDFAIAYTKGPLFDKNNKPIVHLGDDPEWRKKVLDGFKMRTKPNEWQAGKFIHPHDACFDKDGNIFVVEWVQTGRVTLLKKV